jgi:hypothetical protein
LILVRPDGIDAYYAVREAIQSWSENFGYELIGSDWQLQFPKTNEALKERLNAQLTASRERMLPFKAALMQQLSSKKRETGGSGNSNGNRRFSETPPRSFASNNRQSSANNGGTNTGTSGGYAVNSNGNRSVSNTPQSNVGNYNIGNGGNAMMNPSVSETNNGGGNFIASDKQSELNGSQISGNSGFGSREIFSPTVNEKNNAQPFDINQLSLTAINPSLQNGQTQEQSQEQNQTQGESQRFTSAANTLNQNGQNANGQNQNLQNSYAQNQNNQSSNGQPQSGDSQQAASRFSASGSGVSIAAPPPDKVMPNVYRGATEMVRIISAECREDKIIFKVSGNRGIDREIPFPPSGTVYDTRGVISSAIRDYIETWGTPGEGMYWQPEFSVTIAPGAERRFEELKSLLQNSGIKVKSKN